MTALSVGLNFLTTIIPNVWLQTGCLELSENRLPKKQALSSKELTRTWGHNMPCYKYHVTVSQWYWQNTGGISGISDFLTFHLRYPAAGVKILEGNFGTLREAEWWQESSRALKKHVSFSVWVSFQTLCTEHCFNFLPSPSCDAPPPTCLRLCPLPKFSQAFLFL